MKKEYQSPIINVISMKVESHLLDVSVTTTDPKEGGDPTGGNGETPNPFKPSSAKAGLFNEEEEDFKMW
ncbi:aminotransferase [Prevotella disiens]|uniref:Aminotransferase n=1 Tax=Prevotella disiens TaxID=28130 RepID=A0A3E4QJ74_9BACT|nr:aminotransferase [Prevotella disiens]RGK98253.1 aminotransferase [Prevotella disiens]